MPLAAVGTPEAEAAARARAATGVRVVAPLVARHFDFLEELCEKDKLPVPRPTFEAAMASTTLLLGSAPVGPTTVQRLTKYAGALPTVRFGSTETCLQVLGTPLGRSEDATLASFRAGWAHKWAGEKCEGYYIGRPHPPHTEAKVVRSVERGARGYLEECAVGEPGMLVCRGGNLMSGYVANAEATARVIDRDAGGMYLNLGDVCFYLEPEKGVKDFYWRSRDSALLIRGGANYAYEQINAELKEWAKARYALPDEAGVEALDVAVVGLKLESEHEDACCVTIELCTDAARAARPQIEETFLQAAGGKGGVSKGAKPDKLRIATIPRNFKGAVQLPDLVAEWKVQLGLSPPPTKKVARSYPHRPPVSVAMVILRGMVSAFVVVTVVFIIAVRLREW